MQKLYELIFADWHVPLPQGMKSELGFSGLELTEKQFSQKLAGNALSGFILAIVPLLAAMNYSTSIRPAHALLLSLSVSALFFFYTYRLPAVRSAEAAKEIESNLVFAARDLHISLKTGLPLNVAVRNAASGNYGAISTLFEKAHRYMENGDTEKAAFGKIAASTKSEYFHRLLSILSDAKSVNTAPSLEQYIDEAKRARARRLQNYEIKSELYSSILPIIFVGSAAFALVSVVAGFHLYSSLPLPFLLFLNFVLIPATLTLLLTELQSANPGV